MTRTSITAKEADSSMARTLPSSRITRLLCEYEFSSLDLAQKPFEPVFFQDLVDEGLLRTEEQLKLILALQEALTNSIEHGNLELRSSWKDEINDHGVDKYSLKKTERLSNPDYANRKVRLSIEYASKELIIKIHDDGKGFNLKNITRSEPGSAILCYGRGLTIMDQVMDSVEYGEGGRSLEMRRKLATQARASELE